LLSIYAAVEPHANLLFKPTEIAGKPSALAPNAVII
jgi:hypothetical protein